MDRKQILFSFWFYLSWKRSKSFLNKAHFGYMDIDEQDNCLFFINGFKKIPFNELKFLKIRLFSQILFRTTLVGRNYILNWIFCSVNFCRPIYPSYSTVRKLVKRRISNLKDCFWNLFFPGSYGCLKWCESGPNIRCFVHTLHNFFKLNFGHFLAKKIW